MNEIGILGAGGQADETASYLAGIRVAFNAVSEDYRNKDDNHQITIDAPTELQREIPVVAAFGAPAVRKEMVELWPGNQFSSVLSEAAYIDSSAIIAEGVIVAPNATITTNVEIGAHSIINVGATVSHNSKLGEFVTISPGGNVAGNVVLGDGVFVGIGATISNGLKIAAGTVIGAGAVVIDDITTENTIVIGVPAQAIKQNEGWLREI